jgi:hypothetical protein
MKNIPDFIFLAHSLSFSKFIAFAIGFAGCSNSASIRANNFPEFIISYESELY